MVEFQDCLVCDTVCCKNTAIHLFPDEYKRIKEVHPEIDKYIKKVTDTYYSFQFPNESCPFLKGNLCSLRIEGIEPPLGCQFGPFYISQEIDTNSRIILTVGRNSVCPSAKEVKYSSQFGAIFYRIVKELRKANPDLKLHINEGWLLEGEFW